MTESEQIDPYLSNGELTYEGWKSALRDGVLLGQRCNECGQGTVTSAAACPHCSARDLDVFLLPREGEVYSETSINVAPTAFEGSYTVTIVRLSEQLRITAHVRDTVSIGDTVSFEGVLEDDEEPAPIFG